MPTSLKTGFAQIFSCYPKNLGCPKFGGAAAPSPPPVRTPMKTLGKLEENLSETSDYFTVASCPPMPRPRAHAPNKQGGKPAGQDTSSYTYSIAIQQQYGKKKSEQS